MRPRPDSGSGIEVLRALTQLDDALNDLKAVLSSQDRGLTTLGRNLTDLQKNAAELRATIGEIEATVNGETRALREELLGQGTRMDLLDSKLSQIESLQGSVANMVDKRLRALNTQVTTAVAAMAIVVAVGMVLLVLLR